MACNTAAYNRDGGLFENVANKWNKASSLPQLYIIIFVFCGCMLAVLISDECSPYGVVGRGSRMTPCFPLGTQLARVCSIRALVQEALALFQMQFDFMLRAYSNDTLSDMPLGSVQRHMVCRSTPRCLTFGGFDVLVGGIEREREGVNWCVVIFTL